MTSDPLGMRQNERPSQFVEREKRQREDLHSLLARPEGVRYFLRLLTRLDFACTPSEFNRPFQRLACEIFTEICQANPQAARTILDNIYKLDQRK